LFSFQKDENNKDMNIFNF